MSLSSIDIHQIVKQLQTILESKISGVFLGTDYSIILELYSATIKKQFLQLKVPNHTFLLKEKDETIPVNDFARQIKQELGGLVIKKIEQLGTDRVIVIEFNNEHKLFIEFFLRGNIIITNKENKIIALMDKKIFSERENKIGEELILPKGAFDYKNEKNYDKIIKENISDTTGYFIATRLNLGKVVSDKICTTLNIDKNKFANELTEKEKKEIYLKIQEILKEDNIKFTESFSKYKEELKKKAESKSKYTAEINRVKKLIKKQEALMENNAKNEDEHTKKGNKIYEEYETINEALKKITENELILENKEFLNQHNIKKVDKKKKQIIFSF